MVTRAAARRATRAALAVLAACGQPGHGDRDAGSDSAAVPGGPPARLPDAPVVPLAWQLGAPLAPAVVTGRIYDDLAAHLPDRMRDLAALGVRIIRIEIERTTPWSTYRAIIAAARGAGIEVLAIVSQHTLAPGAPGPLDGTLADFDAGFVPAYLAALDETVTELDPHFVEVWNEPDVFGFAPLYSYPPCAPNDAATRYALLAVRVFETIDGRRHAGTPTPVIAAFGLSRQDDACLRRAVFDAEPIRNHRAGYRAPHGLPDGLPADILAMHGYGNAGVLPGDAGYTYAGGTFADGVDELLRARFADGAPVVGALPIWYTEVGYSLNRLGSIDPASRQATALATVYSVLAARPRVTAAFWYDYRDDDDDGPERCGLRDSATVGLAPHPSYLAMQAAAAVDDLTAPAGALDLTARATPGQPIDLRGWAIDADGAAPVVDVAIDGAIVATVVDGAAPDPVACTIAWSARCPAVGFAVTVNAPATAGVHEIAARARDGRGNARVIGRTDVIVDR